MDKVLVKRLLFIADAYSLLLRTYIGRRVVTSCEYMVHLLLEKIHALQQMGEEDIVSLLMLNVSGAFNNVLHCRLIYCLRKRRIPTLIVNWINSFLIGRSTYIRLLEGILERFSILIGILQGLLILLILYLFYNADLLDIAIDKDRLRYRLVIGYINNTSIIVNGRTTKEITKTLAMLYERAEKQANQHALVFALQKYELIYLIPLRKKILEENRKHPLVL